MATTLDSTTNGEVPRFELTKPVSYQFETEEGNIRIDILTDETVWAPHSAPYIIQEVIRSEEYLSFKNNSVVDLGCGTGILGIAALLMGATHVYFLDNNPSALLNTEINLRFNGISPDRYTIIHSDVLSSLPQDNKYDVVIGNLPMNPEGVKIKNAAFRSNQNGDGRYVQSKLIEQAPKFLNPGGKIIFSASSRQNLVETISDLEDLFGKNSWRIINQSQYNNSVPYFLGMNEALSMDYHGPYIDKWDGQTINDGIVRIFFEDEFGRPYFEFESGRVRTVIFYSDIKGDGIYEPIKMKINGDKIPKFFKVEADGSSTLIEFTGNVPSFDPTNRYHNYCLFSATYDPSNLIQEA